MSALLVWLGLGIVAGLLAKLVMPGRDPGGFIVTILLGIVGAMLGGFIGTRLGIGSVTGFNIESVLVATGGAILVLVIYRVVRKNS
jgi:uncharacterized membrane protein YeaQ/YmgE (transglycosylase-associated protein family)